MVTDDFSIIRVHELIANMNYAVTRARYGWILFFARRYDDAVAVLDEALELDPDFLPARDNLKWVHMRMGRPEVAFEDLLDLIRIEGASPEDIESVRRLHEQRGIDGVIQRIITEMEARAVEVYQSPFDLALEYATLGDVDHAMRWLERSYHEREVDLTALQVDPRLDPLRADPRFADLVARVGLPNPGVEGF